jgi:hypothetical protein
MFILGYQNPGPALNSMIAPQDSCRGRERSVVMMSMPTTTSQTFCANVTLCVFSASPI